MITRKDLTPISILYKPFHANVMEIKTCIPLFAAAIKAKDMKEARTLEKRLDEAFSSFSTYMKKLGNITSDNKKEQELYNNIKACFVQVVQDNLPMFRVLKKELG